MKVSKSILGSLFAVVFIFEATLQTFAQIELPAITISAANYKYLNAVNPEEAAQPVNMLEQYAAAYDVKAAPFYDDVYDNYVVSFYIPEGKILAAYDKDGKLIRTAERFKDVAVPDNVRRAVEKRFPNWAISKDVYKVIYHSTEGWETMKVYKLILENGNKRMRVKLADNGDFMQ